MSAHIAFPVDDVCSHFVERLEDRQRRGLGIVERGEPARCSPFGSDDASVANQFVDERLDERFSGQPAVGPAHFAQLAS